MTFNEFMIIILCFLLPLDLLPRLHLLLSRLQGLNISRPEIVVDLYPPFFSMFLLDQTY